MSGVGYWVLWILCRGIARLCFRFRVIGQEHIPRHGPVVIASNHGSYLDIPFLGIASRRRLRFLGRQDLFPIPGLRWILQRLAWIPIRQDRFDRSGFGYALELLQRGEVVVIFPEGGRTRTGALQPGKPGIGMLIAEHDWPVVPAHISGAFDAWPMDAKWIKCHPVTVRFGAAMRFADERMRMPKKEFYRHVSRTVMHRIADVGQVAPPPEHRAGTTVAQG